MRQNILLSFGKAVRKYRQAKGYSQEALAGLCDLHRTYIGSVERGERNITLLNMARIASALEVTLQELIREAENHT